MNRRILSRKRRGFTVIEMLLAVAVSALIMTYLLFNVVTLSNVWLMRNDGEFFEEHANGVAFFLNNALSRAEGVTSNANYELAEEDFEEAREEDVQREEETEERTQTAAPATDPVDWDKLPGAWRNDDPLLTFRLGDPPPVLSAEGDTLPGLICHIQFAKNEGLALLWRSALVNTEDVEDLNATLLSPYVASMQYCYYDDEDDDWRLEEEPWENDDGEYPLPEFINLIFEYEDQELQRKVFIPKLNNNVPVY